MNEREKVQLDLPTAAHFVLILTSEYPISIWFCYCKHALYRGTFHIDPVYKMIP